MDPKDTWPVVKFLMAATGLKTRDARSMLEELSQDRYSQLFIRSRAWERDTSAQASKVLGDLLGDEQLTTLIEATRRAQKPSTFVEASDAPKRRKRR